MENKRIVILNTGGTLSSVMKENGLAPGLRTSDIQKEIRMVSRGIDLETQDLCSLDSANIFPEDWTNLAGKVAELRRECDGIVIIHGTDTMAYTSSMLSFMLRNIDIPVVLTGSQLSMVNPVADAMENLRCAVHMAASGAPGVVPPAGLCPSACRLSDCLRVSSEGLSHRHRDSDRYLYCPNCQSEPD